LQPGLYEFDHAVDQKCVLGSKASNTWFSQKRFQPIGLYRNILAKTSWQHFEFFDCGFEDRGATTEQFVQKRKQAHGYFETARHQLVMSKKKILNIFLNIGSA
jgi:hypothetical protein